jgi:energy-coupling factor transporter ATP-binding protein EcfA2
MNVKLSTQLGNPIAKIYGSKKHKTLNIVTEDDSDYSDSDNEEVDVYDLISENQIEKMCGTKAGKKLKIPDEYISLAKARKNKEFHLKDGILQPIPNIKLERDMLYVAGPSGSGKSTYIAMYLNNYKKLFKKNKIYVFSKLTSDPAFDHLKPIYVELNVETMIEDPIKVEDLSNSCCVFDDIDVITDKYVRKAVQLLRDQCLEIGRHNCITVCATSHQIMNYAQTRQLINEAQSVTMFPRSGSGYQIRRFLQVYGGLDKKAIERIMELPSRWITIHKNAPMYVMYTQGVILL